MEYEEYEIENDVPIFSSNEELVDICSRANLIELVMYHEACVAEELYDYARYVNKLIKNEQAK